MKFNPYIEIILATVLWGTGGVFVKFLSLHPVTLSAFRLAFPALCLALLITVRKGWGKQDKRMLLLASVLHGARMPFYFMGYMYTTLSNAIIILYSWPIFATLFSALILKETIAKRNLIFLGVAFAGIIIVFSNQELSFTNRDFIGMSSMLLVAIVYAVTVIIFKSESGKFSHYEAVFYQNLVGAVVFLPLMFIMVPLPSIKQTVIALIYASLTGIFAFSLFFSALRRIKASTASIFTYNEVLTTCVFGIIIFKEKLTLPILVGGSMILLSTLLLKREP
ncbi:MAG: EamA family transporter [Deltaproteobacteria bacterium]|nr:EamA family transporter [Deltaproteobacteria bacterium]